MKKKIGTFNALNVYEVSKQEYIDEGCYLMESTYFAITDDIVMIYGRPHKKFIYRNRVRGLLNQSNSILEEGKCVDMDKVYYVRPTGYERSAAKEDEVTQRNKEFDVDAFLGSPQSVDEYLEMMKNVDYGSNLCDCTA
jgi:hypothetical protein